MDRTENSRIDCTTNCETNSNQSDVQALLGWTIGAMCLCHKCGVNYAFIVNSVPPTYETVSDLMVTRQHLYLAIVERAQYFIDITGGQPILDYLKSLECLPKLFAETYEQKTREHLSELVSELEGHMIVINRFVSQMRFTIRALELILDNCAKDDTCDDLFDADIRYRELKSVYECFNCFPEKLNGMISELKNN